MVVGSSPTVGVFWFRGCDELKYNHHRVNASQSRLVCCRVRALLCFCRRCSHTLWRRKGTPDSSQGPADLHSAILACAVSVMVGVSRLPNHRKFVFASQEKAHLTSDAATDWLRRWARNPLGSARRGSNLLGVDWRLSSQLRRGMDIVISGGSVPV